MTDVHEWDAAYVLGALSAAERREFEDHLVDCAECRASVAELAVMPGLLGRLSAAEGLALLDVPAVPAPSEPPAQLTRNLAHLAARRRRRTRAWVTGALLAAAVAVAAIAVPTALERPSAPTAQATLTQTVPNPLVASVALRATGSATSLELNCTYTNPTGSGTTNPYTSGDYALYVTDASGHATRVSTWSAAPGDTVRMTGSVAVPESSIRTVDIRDASSGAVLLTAKL